MSRQPAETIGIVIYPSTVFRHVMKINKCRLWGPWEIEWVVDLDDIISIPKMNCTELVLNMRQVRTRFSVGLYDQVAMKWRLSNVKKYNLFHKIVYQDFLSQNKACTGNRSFIRIGIQNKIQIKYVV